MSRTWVLAALLASATGAGAVEIAAETTTPQPLADRQITIGSRTVRLPDGQWQAVAHLHGVVTRAALKIGDTEQVYAVDTRDRRFRNGVVLRLPVAGVRTDKWLEDPCKGTEGALMRDDFGNDQRLPQCLTVTKRNTHLRKTSGEFYPQAEAWAQQAGVALPGPVYEVFYARYANNDYGWMRVFVPQASVAGDDAIVAWARGLPEAMRRLFENRDSEATLPAIPSKD